MIRAEVTAGGVWRVTLGRLERGNARREEDYVLLADLLGQIGRMEGARAVLVEGEGPSFCAGNDLDEFETRWPQPEEVAVVRLLDALRASPLPLLAAVQGGAAGIGATMLLHFDVVVAAPDAFLVFPFVDLGITVEGGASQLLPQRIGRARAMEILLTGRRVHAEEALRLGLVSRVAREAPRDEAAELARLIASKPPAAVQATGRLVGHPSSDALCALIREEIGTIDELIERKRRSAAPEAP